MLSDYRFAVVNVPFQLKNRVIFEKSYIAIKKGKKIVMFTNLHKYIDISSGGRNSGVGSLGKKPLYITQMLNYILIRNYEKYHIARVVDITSDALKDFFDHYAQEPKPNKEYRGEQSVKKCVRNVSEFMFNVICENEEDTALTKDDLYKKKTNLIGDKGKKIETQLVHSVPYLGDRDGINIKGDFPRVAFEILLNQAVTYAREISLGVVLGGCAGLRPGEICNVRQESSIYGSGIRIIKLGNNIDDVVIDLSKEYSLRSDKKVTGKIKSERKQTVYPDFLPWFNRVYKLHLTYLESCKYESDYAPMFVNQKGLAMTVQDFRYRWEKLTKQHFIPELLKSANSSLVLFGKSLQNKPFGPHMLRHWFSLELVMRGESLTTLQYYRGDKSPDSSYTYLKGKSDLKQLLINHNESFLNIAIRGGNNE